MTKWIELRFYESLSEGTTPKMQAVTGTYRHYPSHQPSLNTSLSNLSTSHKWEYLIYETGIRNPFLWNTSDCFSKHFINLNFKNQIAEKAIKWEWVGRFCNCAIIPHPPPTRHLNAPVYTTKVITDNSFGCWKDSECLVSLLTQRRSFYTYYSATCFFI